MANNIDSEITKLQDQVSATVGVMESATTLINGFQAILDAAIETATNAGATPEQLASFEAISAKLDTTDDSLAAAVAAHPKPAAK